MPKLSLRRKKKITFSKPIPANPRKQPHEDNATFVLRLQGKNSVLYRRFNFEAPKRPLIEVDRRGKLVRKIKFPKTLKVGTHPGYAFWVKGEKHIGTIREAEHIGLSYVQLRESIKDANGNPIKLKDGRFKTKDHVVPRSAISMSPWDLNVSIRREEPPKDVLFKDTKLDRYKRAGGQQKKRGLKITVYNIEQMEREDKL